MTQPNLRELAKQGNSKAIATLINRSLQSHNITAKVGRKDDCLKILLESDQIPNQQTIVPFIRKGLTNLGVESVNTVKVYARHRGEESVAWQQTFELVSPEETFSSNIPEVIQPEDIQPEDIQDSLPGTNWHKVSRPVSPRVETPPITEPTDVPTPHSRLTSSQTQSPPQPIRPLSVGNVVSAGLRLYRDHFKLYFGLAFQAYLWVLVPIYGWAKFAAISALISRLAFNELTGSPETVTQARRHVNPKMWDFLIAGFLMSILLSVALLGFIIVFGIVFGILGTILATVFGQGIASMIVVSVLLGLISLIIFIFGATWIYARFSIVELPLAMENNVGSVSALSRSWDLTKGFVLRLVGVFFVAFLITIPAYIIVQVVTSIIQIVFNALFANSAIFGVLYVLLTIALILANASLFQPFWQAIKAVIYYDLRSRREGMGLQLRD